MVDTYLKCKISNIKTILLEGRYTPALTEFNHMFMLSDFLSIVSLRVIEAKQNIKDDD